jgi:hypothetical protein
MSPISPTLPHLAGSVLLTCLIIPTALCSALALWFRVSDRRAVKSWAVACWTAFSGSTLAAVWIGNPAAVAIAYASAYLGVLIWWVRLRPTNDAEWADELARTSYGAIDGNRVTLHNVRNFEWRTTSDYTPRWETREFDLRQLRSVDMCMSYWRGPAIAHMVMSFGFDDAARVAFSVEIRRKKDQEYSEIGGFFKDFELSVIAVDELDVIWLRTNVRRERVYIYRLHMPQDAMRGLFLGYVEEANLLAQSARFYHTITSNCTTLVFRIMQRVVGGLPWSFRLLLSGYLPEYVYRIGGLDTRYPLEELRARGFVSERAQACSRGSEFSTFIREGIQ